MPLDMLAMAQGPFLRAFQHSCPRLGVNGRSLEENEESVGIHRENAGHCMRMWEMSGKATRGLMTVEGGQGGAEPLTIPIDPQTQRHSNKYWLPSPSCPVSSKTLLLPQISLTDWASFSSGRARGTAKPSWQAWKRETSHEK